MPAPLVLAAAQLVPRRGDVAANVASHVALAQRAADEGAALVLFPELSLTGYELELARGLAFGEDDARLAPLLDVASSRGTTLVVGAPVRLGARLHIGAFVLSPDGSTGIYTKARLGTFPGDVSPNGVVPPPEPDVFDPGDRDPSVELDGRRAAIAICADTGDAGHPERAAARGAGIYLASMFFTPGELAGEEAKLGGYAERHRMAVVLANFGGPSGGLEAAGGSAVWSPAGERLAQLARGTGLVVATEASGEWRARAIAVSDAGAR